MLKPNNANVFSSQNTLYFIYDALVRRSIVSPLDSMDISADMA